MSDLVGNPEDRFSRVAAPIISNLRHFFTYSNTVFLLQGSFESRHEKNRLLHMRKQRRRLAVQ